MAADRGQGLDTMSVGVLTHARETGGHRTQFRADKWDADQVAWARRRLDIPRRIEPSAKSFRELKLRPFETYLKEDCNLILDAGWQLLMNGLAGSAITKFSSTVGRIGGGISATANAYTFTDMQAATGAANRQWELVSSTPTVGATHITGLIFAATFPTTDGNFAWAEFAVDQGTAGGTGAAVATCLLRGTASPGTKTSAQTWNVTVTIGWT